MPKSGAIIAPPGHARRGPTGAGPRLSTPATTHHSRNHPSFPQPPIIPATTHHSRNHPSFPQPPIIPATHPSFPHPNRHSRTPTVIPAPQPSFPQPNRHSRNPTVIPAPQPSFPHPNRHSRTPTVIPAPQPSFPHPNRHSGESRNLAPPLHPSSRRQPASGHSPYLPSSRRFTTRHPGASRHPGIPHIYRHSPYLPSSRRFTTRHPGPLPAIPALYPPSRPFTRHSGESRNLAPPPYSTFPRSNGPPAKPPEKSAIFSDATHLRSVHKCCTLAISKSGNPASGK